MKNLVWGIVFIILILIFKNYKSNKYTDSRTKRIKIDNMDEFIKQQTESGVIIKDEYGNIKNPEVISKHFENMDKNKVREKVIITDSNGKNVDEEKYNEILEKIKSSKIDPKVIKQEREIRDEYGNIVWKETIRDKDEMK